MPGSRRHATMPSGSPAPTPVPQRATGSHRLVGRRRPRSRTLTGVVWAGVCGAVLATVSLVVFLMPGSSSGPAVSLFGMAGTVPVVSALLMAGAAAAIMIAVVAVARLRLQDGRG